MGALFVALDESDVNCAPSTTSGDKIEAVAFVTCFHSSAPNMSCGPVPDRKAYSRCRCMYVL